MIHHSTQSTNLGMFKSTYPSKKASLQPYKKHTLYDIFEEEDEEEEDYNDCAANSNQHYYCYFPNKRHSTSSSYSISDHLETIYEVEEEQQD